MSLSSSFRLFSPNLPLSLPSSKPISKGPFFLSPKFPPTPHSLTSKPHLRTPFSSSSSSPSSLSQPLDDLPSNLQHIIKLFQSVQDPRSKYEQLIFYGRKLPPLDARFKTVENKVQGCVSQVWVRAFLDAERNVRFEAESDSSLTKGLAALLVEGLSGRPAAEIARVPPAFVQMLGLNQTLTPSRNNGFLNMLRLMQKKALQLDLEAGEGGGSIDEGFFGVEGGAQGLNSGGVLVRKKVAKAVGDLVSNADSGIEGDAIKGLNTEKNGTGEIQSNSNVVMGGSVVGLNEKRSSVGEINLNSDGVIDPNLRNSGGGGEIKLNSEVGLGSRAERIKERLEKELFAIELEVEDISYQHAGHAGVRGSEGETHFNLKIVSKEFEGKSMLKRHRIVYDLLQDELCSGLHALSIVAKTPSEAGGT